MNDTFVNGENTHKPVIEIASILRNSNIVSKERYHTDYREFYTAKPQFTGPDLLGLSIYRALII